MANQGGLGTGRIEPRDVIGWVTNSPSSLSYSGALWNWNMFERTIWIGSTNKVTLLEVLRKLQVEKPAGVKAVPP